LVIKAVICEDPSNFLEENQDLAKSVKHILICNIDEISQRPNMDVATLQSVLGKYEGFIKRITQK